MLRRNVRIPDPRSWHRHVLSLTQRPDEKLESVVLSGLQRFTIIAKLTGSRLAPPTRNPSISGCVIRVFALSGLTLPPYRIRRLFAASAPKLLFAWARMSR